jgi:putative ATPase
LQSPLFKGYKYPHSYPDHYVSQQYLPDDLKDRRYYNWGANKLEDAARQYWEKIKK